MSDFLVAPASVPLLEQVAIFAERRHDVLAGNLANISTPGYKTRDLPVTAFQQALQKAVEQQQSPPANSSRAASLGGGPAGVPAQAPLRMDEIFTPDLFRSTERVSGDLTFQDASNRNVESEVMEMTKNVMLQNYATELMSAQFNLLQAVISERP